MCVFRSSSYNPRMHDTSSTDATHARGIHLVGFDADDTLWRSEDYFAAAQPAISGIAATTASHTRM